MEVLLQKPGETTAKMVNLRATQTMLEILECLEVQGYVLLKEATVLDESWDWTVQDLSDNKSVRRIINGSRECDFRIFGYYYLYSPPMFQVVDRADVLLELPVFTGFECVHLGGGKDTNWVIKCGEGKRGEKTDTFTPVEAAGGDIFLCNARLNRTHPRPMVPKGEKRNFVLISYVAKTAL